MQALKDNEYKKQKKQILKVAKNISYDDINTLHKCILKKRYLRLMTSDELVKQMVYLYINEGYLIKPKKQKR